MNENKIRVLIVDDDESSRNIYADVFKQSGFEVSEAVDGIDGLDKATKNIPDVIFTGIIMPRMDGFALKDALSKNVNTAKIPVFILSHMGREEDRQRAIELGAKDFIIQGMITPRQVVEKVKVMFGPGEYTLKIKEEELDASKLMADLHLKEGLKCPQCGGDMVLKMRVKDVVKYKFDAQLICPQCKAKQDAMQF
jgi:PleD family two-component response regulator